MIYAKALGEEQGVAMKLLLGYGFFLFFCGIAKADLPKASDFKEVGEAEEVSTPSEVAPEAAKLAASEQIFSGTVRVIRKIDMTEVFFKDLKDSYYIPSGSQYSSIYKALDESMKKGTAVGFKANTKSRRILSLESAPVKSPSLNSSGAK